MHHKVLLSLLPAALAPLPAFISGIIYAQAFRGKNQEKLEIGFHIGKRKFAIRPRYEALICLGFILFFLGAAAMVMFSMGEY